MSEQHYSYADFLDDIDERRVFVSGLGVGNLDGAWVTISGRDPQPSSSVTKHYLANAINSGQFEIASARLVTRTSTKRQPPP